MKHKDLKYITLCGSTKFRPEYEYWNKKLTIEGNVVYSVSCFGHSGDIITDEEKIMLDRIHKAKIDNSDEIFVLDVNGYIGSSTKSEIEYAKKKRKIIKFLREYENKL